MTKGSKSRGSLSDLAKLVEDAGIHLDPAAPATRREPAPPPEPPAEAVSDEDLFARAVGDVTKASWKHGFPPSPLPPHQARPDSESEDLRLMEAAVEGIPAMMVLDHPEYIEGWIGVAGKRFLPNLRNGLYSIQGQIDLHGLSQEEARLRVEEFIVQKSRFRSCCVKIIHGRGINSPNDRAVLKESLQRWLSTRRMSRHVVAYASAPLKDGGVGAVYVLLRRY
jgi:DNA-nicking Smr family endonuclease